MLNVFKVAGLTLLFGMILSSATHASDQSNARAVPVSVVFDTDMYSDIDDSLALAMLHALEDRGEVKLLAVTVGTDAPFVAPYVDLVNTFYGHGDVPIGITRGGITAERFKKKAIAGKDNPWSPNGVNYTEYTAELKDADGRLRYPHRITDSRQAGDSVSLLRKVLAEQPDNSVVMIQVGYATTFARLLNSEADKASSLDGKELIKQKVKLLSTMTGSFRSSSWYNYVLPAGGREANIAVDIPAAREVFSKWPTPIVASGFEIGSAMLFRRTSVDRYFKYNAHHPIADTYLYVDPVYADWFGLSGRVHDHHTCDLTAVLYAARPEEDYFHLSQPGTIVALDNGGSRFIEGEGGQHRYLVLADGQKARVLEAMEMLVTQPPAKRTSAASK